MKKRLFALLACATMIVGVATGCMNNDADNDTTPPTTKDVDVKELLTTIKGSYGPEDTWPASQPLDATLLKDLYGIDEADLESYVAEMPMMNVQVDEFFIAKVKDGKMDTVKAGLEKRAKDLEAQWEQYLPEKLEIVKNHKLVVNGNYIMLAVSEFSADAEKTFNEATK